jgi:hypothetical protein
MSPVQCERHGLQDSAQLCCDHVLSGLHTDDAMPASILFDIDWRVLPEGHSQGRKMSRGTAIVLALGLFGLALSCRRSPDLVVGGIYSIADDGRFGVAKLLARDEGICHVRVYKQKFASRPEGVDPSKLSLGTVHDKDGFGMGHLPLGDASFQAWQPVLILKTQVTPEELEGYRMWKDAGGGVF